MKKALHIELMFLFMVSLIACTGSKQSALTVTGSPMSKTRFTVSSDGVVCDSKTALEWITGPGAPNYPLARNWVTSCEVAGGGWRMPTLQELKTLHQPGVALQNMVPAFNFTGTHWVWAESRDSSEATLFDIDLDMERTVHRTQDGDNSVFAVRPRPQ